MNSSSAVIICSYLLVFDNHKVGNLVSDLNRFGTNDNLSGIIDFL